MSNKASNEAQEKLRAWRENCLSCRHLLDRGTESRCNARNKETPYGWVYAPHTADPALTLSDVARAAHWASLRIHLDVSWLPVAASCMPSCTHYERALQ